VNAIMNLRAASNVGKFFELAERLPASQEGLSSVE
jgi:hypothetical protein